MKCGYCGKDVKDDAQFCSNCGHSIEEQSDDSIEPQKAEKGAYAVSILALLIVLALMAYGSFVIVYRDLSTSTTLWQIQAFRQKPLAPRAAIPLRTA